MGEETNDINSIETLAHEVAEEMNIIKSWFTLNNKEFFFNYTSVSKIPSGLYSMVFTDGNGFGVSKMDYKSEEFFNLPSLPHKEIISELDSFWGNKEKFKEYNLTHKRGIIIHGEPGCGKTSLIYLLIERIKELDGIAIYFDAPQNWIAVAKIIRNIEVDRPILCIIEDLDIVIGKYGEGVFLNFLDGLNGIENVVYVATTNNLSRIPPRIRNRPSRFDKQYLVGKPTNDDREMYFNLRLHDDDKKKYSIKKIVKDTKGFSMAHLKELFISLYILNMSYIEAIKRLQDNSIVDNEFGYTTNDEDPD